MPASTPQYPFEVRLLTWAETLSRSLCGHRTSLFFGFRPDGTLRRVYFSPPGVRFDGERKELLASTYPQWFLFTPEDDAGDGYLEWLDLPREVAERWLAGPLRPEDFVDARTGQRRDGWPTAWRAFLRH